MHAQRHWKLMLATGLALTGLMATATGASAPPPADPPRIAGVEAPAQNTDFFDDLYNALTGHSGDNDNTGGHDDCGTDLTNTSDGNASTLAMLPFPVAFFPTAPNQTYSSLYVNNDGTVTFDAPQSTFPGTTLTTVMTRTIAPFLADAAAGSQYPRTGKVSYGSVWGGSAFCVRWEDMRQQSPPSGGTAENSFSLLLRKPNNTATGDFDIDFRYQHIGWDLGKPLDSAASVGLTKGTGAANTYFVLPGSQTPGAFVDGGSN
ncbi:MAG TPA: hypothetical protein VE081_00055, partial [Sporichthyaceae bacterium]|nr:hypothetical protein [Sporichthyaceae bacterium]